MDIKSVKIWAKVKIWAQGALVVWAVAILPVMMTPLMMAIPFAPRWPSWLELPLWNLSDFIVAPDGRIFVYTSFYDYMMVYEDSGDFQSSWPGPLRLSAGGHCLSVGEEGRVFLKIDRTVFALSPDGEELFRVSGDRTGSRVWRLTERGEVEVVHNPLPKTQAPKRPVRNGEILFGEECGFFYQKNMPGPYGGSVQRRVGPRLQILFPDGHSRTIMTSWYLLWGHMPVPFVPRIVLSIWLKPCCSIGSLSFRRKRCWKTPSVIRSDSTETRFGDGFDASGAPDPA